MPAILERCRDYLATAYLEKLGTEFSESLCQLETGRQPVWRFVSPDDLTSETSPNDRAVGALLDPEIGILFYLSAFDHRTDLRQQIICAVALGSRLSMQAQSESQAGAGDRGDVRGPWRVVLHWLVYAEDRRAWIEKIAEIRRETPFCEDVSLDAIFLNVDDDLESQFDRHGFPRLLLHTREVLRKERIGEVARWMSADDLVRTTLSGFSSRFQRPEQHELAQGIVQAVEQFKAVSTDAPNVVRLQEARPIPQTLDRIHVENFRNLGDMTLDFGPDPVSANIIHGSNGTGKTSLCEAISLALFGSSAAYRAFADRSREKDVSATDRAREYTEQYLRSIGPVGQSEDSRPKIAVNREPLLPPQLLAAAEIGSADVAMEGTILHQDTSVEFVRMSAQELGARILRGYSALADYVEEYVESRVVQANSNRQDFLRTFGLSASITKVDTAFGRMARREIDRSLPGFPRPLVEWLDTIQIGAQLAWRWQEWGNESSRNALGGRLSLMDSSPSNLEVEIRSWLEEFNALVSLSGEVMKNVNDHIGTLQQELDQIAARIKTWGDWLDTQKVASPAAEAPGSSEAVQLAGKLDQLQAEQQRVVEQGRDVARHIEHLTQVEAYVREAWGKRHADQCPTCGTSQGDRGGILPVIQSWLKQTASDRDRLRGEYGRLKSQIDELHKILANVGEGRCPITAGEQSRIADALQWLVPGGGDFRQWIQVKTQREELLAILLALKQVPAVPPRVDAENEAARVARQLALQFADARTMFEAPSNWRPVREKLTALLADIVNQHLPRTLGALWCELFLNLTPAPWLLPERPSINVATKRGEQRSTLQVRGRLARYVLNQSEVHILGLGWFFTRYLTRGRFGHACVVMDDPANELDQAGFRDLCRLWETLLRLHRVYQQPFQLIVTLNQETRAIQAARLTGGVLSFLGWTPEQSQPLRATRLIPEKVCAPQPVALFQPASA